MIPLVVVLTVVGVAATAALRQELTGQVDGRLATAVDRSADAVEGLRGGGGPRGHHDGDGRFGGPDFLSARGQSDGTLGARVVDGVATEAGVIGARGQDGRSDARRWPDRGRRVAAHR